jgi:hypothetical protein
MHNAGKESMGRMMLVWEVCSRNKRVQAAGRRWLRNWRLHGAGQVASKEKLCPVTENLSGRRE